MKNIHQDDVDDNKVIKKNPRFYRLFPSFRCDTRITEQLHNHLGHTDVDFHTTFIASRDWDNPTRLGEGLLLGWRQVQPSQPVVQMMALVLQSTGSEQREEIPVNMTRAEQHPEMPPPAEQEQHSATPPSV